MGGLGEVAEGSEAVRGCPEGCGPRVLLGCLRESLSWPCVRNYQVITDDLHLKEGTVEEEGSVFL